MTNKTIGILAGMGPRSTAPFIDQVITQCQLQYDAKHDYDFPHMMIYSLPVPFYLDRPIDYPALKKATIDGLKRLATTGVDFIVMPCNTTHAFYQDLQASIDLPLINMIEVASRSLPANAQRVAVLATSTTIKANLYQTELAKIGKEFIYYDRWQEQIHEILAITKLLGQRERYQNLWHSLIEDIKAAGVDTAIIACTDLNVIDRGNNREIEFLDATNCLAIETIKTYLKD
jgi:aspartate racemase